MNRNLIIGIGLAIGLSTAALLAGALGDALDAPQIDAVRGTRTGATCYLDVEESAAWNDVDAPGLGLVNPRWISRVRVPCAALRTAALSLLSNAQSCLENSGRPSAVAGGVTLPSACP